MSRYPRIAHWDISHFRAPYKAASVQGLGDFIDASSPALEGTQRIAHWDVSHFRAPYKAATVQGFGDFIDASSPALRGDEQYDFITASSPALRGFGVVPSSVSDPMVLVNILKDHFWAYFAGPDYVLELADKIAQPVGDYSAVSTKFYSAFVGLFQAGGTTQQADAIVNATVAWMAAQFQKSSLDGFFVDGPVRAALKALVSQALSTVMASKVSFTPSSSTPLTSAVTTSPSAFGPAASTPLTSAVTTSPSAFGPAASTPSSVSFVPGIPMPTYTPSSPVPIVSVSAPRPGVSPMPRLPATASSPIPVVTLPRKPAPVLVLPRGKVPTSVKPGAVDTGLLTSFVKSGDRDNVAPPAVDEAPPSKLPSWVVPAAVAGVGVVALALVVRRK
jgi:hypothetical protein